MGVAGRDYMRDRPLDLDGGGYGGGSRDVSSGEGFPWRKGRWWALACALVSAGLAALGVFVRVPEHRELAARAATDPRAARALGRASEELNSLGFVAVALALGALALGLLSVRAGGSRVGYVAVVLGLAGGACGVYLLGAS